MFTLNSSSTALVQRTTENAQFVLTASQCALRRYPTCHASFSSRPLHTDRARHNTVPHHDEALSTSATFGLGEPRRLGKLSRWMRLLNKNLPAHLRILEEHSSQEDKSQASMDLNVSRIEKIFSQARSEADTEILLWLVDNGYRRTAVWLMETILSFPTANESMPALKTPSNIDWPRNVFASIRKAPLNSPLIVHRTTEIVDDESQFDSAQFDSRKAQAESRLLGRVWETLGILVIKSANAGTGDAIDDNMLTALLVLGQIHKLGMMPDDVYAYTHTSRPSYAQRPPILNLVSSRILTALSDAAWRQQQDDAISEATRMGMSLREISQNVPGGRFRLKVRPLGPEIWLELILWCCIESNQVAPALAIISNLAAQAEEPWFAIRWTSPHSREKLSALIDWDRAKLRHGGPGGLIEGYSREKPLVDVPEKTISVEVILALIEKLLASVASSSVINTSRLGAFSIHKDFRSLRKTMSDIEDVMTFLEPHDLPPEYFDYLESRLLQDGAFDLPRAPVDLYTWTTRMKSIRDLETIDAEKPAEQVLRLSEIHAQSQLHIGLQHQALSALVEFGDVHHTLAIFNELQENIDKRKVTSIKNFLQHQPAITKEASGLPSKHELEFTNCHGQLPYYKLAGLLNLISDTNLVGLGRWLLYAEDVDGAALPEEAWGLHCMTPALYRFAAVSQDEDLIEVATLKRSRKLMPSVKMLRNLADANMSLSHLSLARKNLMRLRFAAAGGFGLSNVVHLAATVLRLEHHNPNSDHGNDRTLSTAMAMLVDMLLNDSFSSTRSDFTSEVRHLFKRQIHHILSVLTFFRGSPLEKFAKLHIRKFPSSNLALLPARTFNVLLSAGIDAYGAGFGRKMWDRFCRNPDTPYAAELFDADVESLNNAAESDDLVEQDVMSESNSSRVLDLPLSRKTDSRSQDDQSGREEAMIEFEDPFFPKTPSESGGEVETRSENSQGDMPVPFHMHNLTDAPVTVPNLKTLRIIIRAVAGEMKAREEGGLSTVLQRQQLAWAVSMFKAFGIADRNVVEQEIQYPLNEIDAEVVEESRDAIEAAQQRGAHELTSGQDLTAGSPISEMWVPYSKDQPAFM